MKGKEVREDLVITSKGRESKRIFIIGTLAIFVLTIQSLRYFAERDYIFFVLFGILDIYIIFALMQSVKESRILRKCKELLVCKCNALKYLESDFLEDDLVLILLYKKELNEVFCKKILLKDSKNSKLNNVVSLEIDKDEIREIMNRMKNGFNIAYIDDRLASFLLEEANEGSIVDKKEVVRIKNYLELERYISQSTVKTNRKEIKL